MYYKYLKERRLITPIFELSSEHTYEVVSSSDKVSIRYKDAVGPIFTMSKEKFENDFRPVDLL